MATATVTKITLVAKLDNGTNSSGVVQTISQSLGPINKDTFDVDKAYAIAQLLNPVLTKTVYSVEQTTYSSISNS